MRVIQKVQNLTQKKLESQNCPGYVKPFQIILWHSSDVSCRQLAHPKDFKEYIQLLLSFCHCKTTDQRNKPN